MARQALGERPFDLHRRGVARPGRRLRPCLRAAASKGLAAVGVDVSPKAVGLARDAGLVRGSVFGPVPAAGSWSTALLLDGNIGIGGDSQRLLTHIRALLHDHGRVLIELGAPGVEARNVRARLWTEAGVTDRFLWAWVGLEGIEPLAFTCGYAVEDLWSEGGRWFARLRVCPENEAEARVGKCLAKPGTHHSRDGGGPADGRHRRSAR